MANCPRFEGRVMEDKWKYRAIKRLNHAMKLIVMKLGGRIRAKVEQQLGENQLGLRSGRGTTDGMFALRQLVEKRFQMQGEMVAGFLDLENAIDTEN